MGSVLGYLLAGIAIGPFALGFIGREGSGHHAFRRIRRGHDAFFNRARIGALSFLADASSHRRHGGCAGHRHNDSASAAGLILLNFSWKTALAASLALAMSSTAIVLQSLKEKGLGETQAGKSSFAVLLFQDIAVIPILALLPLLAAATSRTTTVQNQTIIGGLPGWLADGGGSGRRRIRFSCRAFYHRSPAAAGGKDPFERTSHRRRLADCNCHGLPDAIGRVESGPGNLPGRSRPGQQRIPPRTGKRHRTFQGTAARSCSLSPSGPPSTSSF